MSESQDARQRLLSNLPERSPDEIRRALASTLPPADEPPGIIRSAAFGANEMLFGQFLPQGARDKAANWGLLPRRGQGPADMPDESRMAYTAGQTFGAGLPFAAAGSKLLPAAAQIPQAAQTAATRYLQPMAQNALNNPGRFAASEVGALAGAAQGAAAAEGLFPGSDGARFAGEVAGSVINPAAQFLKLAGKGGGAIATAVRSMSRAGREQNAAELLQDIASATGEDPLALSRQLASVSDAGSLTTGQLSKSPALRAMESHVARSDPRFAGERENRAQLAYADTRKLIDELVGSGDPRKLAAAARLRQTHFETLIDDRLSQAQREVAEAVARVGRVSGGDQAQASSRAGRIIQEAYGHARGVETELYNAIPRNVRGGNTNLREMLTRYRSELLPTESAPIERHVAPLLGARRNAAGELEFSRQDVSAGELLQIRRRAAALARDAAGRGERDLARQYGDVKAAADADLRAIGIPETEAAHQYSVALNDRFTRSFGGDAMSIDSAGDLRIRPELLLDQAYAGGGIKGNLQFDELARAGDFGDAAASRLGRGLEESLGLGVRNAEEQFLREHASRILDQNGRVNPEKLRLFMRDNAELLERFPALARDLGDAQTAQATFDSVDEAMKRVSKHVTNVAAFSKAAGVEDPSAAVGAMLGGPSPARNYRQLATAARHSGQGATDGLRASTLDYARQRATSRTGDFSFRAFNEQMFTRQGNRASTAQLMMDNNVMTQAQANRLQRIVTRAMDIEDAMRDPTRINEMIPEPDAVFDLAVRMVGANMGGQLAQGAGGQSLVLAGAGVRFMRRALERVPATRTHDILVEAMNNPKLASALLARPRSVAEARRVENQLNSALLQAGLIPKEDTDAN